jgi:hypothetical protein
MLPGVEQPSHTYDAGVTPVLLLVAIVLLAVLAAVIHRFVTRNH